MLVHEICGSQSSLPIKIVEFTVCPLNCWTFQQIVLCLNGIALFYSFKLKMRTEIFKALVFSNLFDILFKKLINTNMFQKAFGNFIMYSNQIEVPTRCTC